MVLNQAVRPKDWGVNFPTIPNPSNTYLTLQDATTGVDGRTTVQVIRDGILQNVVAYLTSGATAEWVSGAYAKATAVHYTDPAKLVSGTYVAGAAVTAGVVPPASPWLLSALDGKDGVSAVSTITTTRPNVPAVGSNAIYSVGSAAGYGIGMYVDIINASATSLGTFLVVGITATSLTLRNVTAIATTTVSTGFTVVASGKPGTNGTNGTNGISAIAVTTGANAVTPAVGASQAYNFVSASGLVTQQYYGFTGIAGTFLLTAIATNSATLQNVDASVGSAVPAGTVLAPVGKAGASSSGASSGGTTGIKYTYSNSSGSAATDPGIFAMTGLDYEWGSILYPDGPAATQAPSSVIQVTATPEDTNGVNVSSQLDSITSSYYLQFITSDTNKYATYEVLSRSGNGISDRVFSVVWKFGNATASDLFNAPIVKIKYQLRPSGIAAGQIQSPNLAVAGTIAISATDAATPGKSAADILARLKVGAIVEIAESLTKRIRGTVTTDYTVGSGSFAISAPLVDGAIGNGAIVFLSIASDAPSTVVGGTGRVTMTADRTYYVRSAGGRIGFLSSETDGTANTDADSFSSPVTALAALSRLDGNGFTPTLKIDAATYTNNRLLLPTIVGSDFAFLELSTGTIIQSSVSDPNSFGGVIEVRQKNTVWEIKGTGTIRVSSSAIIRACLFAYNGSINYRDVIFGQGSGDFGHIWCPEGGLIQATGNYSITGGGASHFYGNAGGTIRCQDRAIALSGSPDFTKAFAIGDFDGLVISTGCTFPGAATGKRYIAENFGKVITGGGANYFPGSSPGTPVLAATEAQIHAVAYGMYY
jgi:hypothetical protein